MSGAPETAEGYDYQRAHQEYWTAVDKDRYCFKLKIKLFIEGNQWCCLFGDNIQDGVAGFGKSPHDAMLDFDAAMVRELK